MNKGTLYAWIAFLVGAALVVGYALKTEFASTPSVEGTVGSGQPQLEITVTGQANGIIIIDLLPDVAPLHVAQVTTLARRGDYDGVVFHRVIEGFMAQTGDVQFGTDADDTSRAGMGGSDLPDIPAEFSEITFAPGIVGMARSSSPDSANSQFFIMLEAGDFLDGQYTVIGRVSSGFAVAQAIKLGLGPNGSVIGAPDVMRSVRVLTAE